MKTVIKIIDQDITKDHKQKNLNSIYLTESKAQGYRQYDDKPYDDYAIRFGEMITNICENFKKDINVLDIACGTGRHFHRLSKVKELHGVDFSLHMLEKAKNPTRISAKDWWRTADIKLFCNTADDYCRNATQNYYDFVYSIGAIAEYGYPEGIIATRHLFNNMARILSKDGVCMFTVHEQNFTKEQIKEFLQNTLMSKMKIDYEKVTLGEWSHTVVTARNY